MAQGIFTVETTDKLNTNTPNICTEATITVHARNVADAVDRAYTVASTWSKGTGIPVVCDGYYIEKISGDPEASTKDYTIKLHVI